MPQQLHKRLSEEQVKAILESYLAGEITVTPVLENLKLKRSNFLFVKSVQRESRHLHNRLPKSQ